MTAHTILHQSEDGFFPLDQWSLDTVSQAYQRQNLTVSLIIPTLNEADHIGAVVDAGVALLASAGSPTPLLDEILVIDSHSEDGTADLARQHGATVYQQEDIFPHRPPRRGKGESLWRGVAASTGDIVMFMDGDLYDPCPDFIWKTLAPLLLSENSQHPTYHMVKGCYHRPLHEEPSGGGRVTELVARPLLASFCPDARFIVQPLGGEYALRRECAEQLPFAVGYGVEIGLLMDIIQRYGAHHVCQVNLGTRAHRNRPVNQLGAMAREVIDTALLRAGITPQTADLLQFSSDDEAEYRPVRVPYDREECPPLVTLESWRSPR